MKSGFSASIVRQIRIIYTEMPIFSRESTSNSHTVGSLKPIHKYRANARKHGGKKDILSKNNCFGSTPIKMAVAKAVNSAVEGSTEGIEGYEPLAPQLFRKMMG